MPIYVREWYGKREGLGYTYDDVARNLCVDKSTVKRIVDRFKLSGNVGKKPYPTERYSKVDSSSSVVHSSIGNGSASS